MANSVRETIVHPTVNVGKLMTFVEKEIRLAMQQEKTLTSALDRAAVARIRANIILVAVMSDSSEAPSETTISQEDIRNAASQILAG